MRATAPALLLSALAAACASGPSRPPRAPMATIGDSLDPLRAWFDAEAAKPRAILILSPT